MGTGHGNVTIVYFYKGKKYQDFRSFDARELTYDDMFLMFIDKTNPKHDEIPNHPEKIADPRNFPQKSHIEYSLDEEDLKKLENFN